MLLPSRIKKKGFTLIEVMVAIAIIGLLAAIAIPNYIAHRNKTFCSAVESDAASAVAAISDYYSIPSHNNLVSWNELGLTPSNGNIVSISGTVDNIIITVTDSTGRCPPSYTSNSSNWNASVFTTGIQ